MRSMDDLDSPQFGTTKNEHRLIRRIVALEAALNYADQWAEELQLAMKTYTKDGNKPVVSAVRAELSWEAIDAFRGKLKPALTSSEGAEECTCQWGQIGVRPHVQSDDCPIHSPTSAAEDRECTCPEMRPEDVFREASQDCPLHGDHHGEGE